MITCEEDFIVIYKMIDVIFGVSYSSLITKPGPRVSRQLDHDHVTYVCLYLVQVSI